MNEEPKLPAVPSESRFSLKQRVVLRVVPWLARTLLILLGRTLRFEHSWEGDPPLPAGTDHPPPGAIIRFGMRVYCRRPITFALTRRS